MLQNDRRLTPGEVKLRLMDSAHPLADAAPYSEGAGELDVAAALNDNAVTSGYDLSTKLGSGSTVLPIDVLLQWQKYGWSKYGWSKYGWSKYGWSKYGWSKYGWSKYGWSKYGWSDYAWSVVINGQ